MNLLKRSSTSIFSFAIVTLALLPAGANAATSFTHAKYFFDASGHIVGGNGLDCANGGSSGGVVTEYSLVIQGKCSQGAPVGPWTVGSVLPDGITQAQACNIIAEEAGSSCTEAPFFTWPLD